jgi:hypothetical protein
MSIEYRSHAMFKFIWSPSFEKILRLLSGSTHGRKAKSKNALFLKDDDDSHM